MWDFGRLTEHRPNKAVAAECAMFPGPTYYTVLIDLAPPMISREP